MKDFTAYQAVTGSNWYDARAGNSTSRYLRNGTPVNKDIVNDIWGALQATIYAGYQHEGTTDSVSDSLETYSSSDFLAGLRRTCGHPGEIVFVGFSVPTGARLLVLSGQVIEIADYPELVEATYIGDGNNDSLDFTGFCKTSDAAGTTRSISGDYFVLPDCRGQFIRGLPGVLAAGYDLGRDDAGTTAKPTSLQEQSYGQHSHVVNDALAGDPLKYDGFSAVDTTDSDMVYYPDEVYYTITTPLETRAPVTDSQRVFYAATTEGAVGTGVHTDYPYEEATNGASEVRPKNIAFFVAVRY